MDTRLLLFLGFALVIAWVIGHAVAAYRATPGTSILTAFQGSMTILWSRLVTVGAALLGVVMQVATFLGDPAITEAIRAALDPKWVPIYVIAIAVVTVWARRRTLPEPPAGDGE